MQVELPGVKRLTQVTLQFAAVYRTAVVMDFGNVILVVPIVVAFGSAEHRGDVRRIDRL